jgi:FAD/FMN-containing dehydrogenase
LLEKNKGPCYGDLGTGIIRMRYMYTKEEELQEKIIKICSGIGCRPCAGSNFGIRKKGYVPESHKNDIKEKKKKYDPKEIMNRGNVI